MVDQDPLMQQWVEQTRRLSKVGTASSDSDLR